MTVLDECPSKRFLVHILVFLKRKVPKFSIPSKFLLDGIPDGPYMTDMDEVATFFFITLKPRVE